MNLKLLPHIPTLEETATNFDGEVAQWLGHRIDNRKISSSGPALPKYRLHSLNRYWLDI